MREGLKMRQGLATAAMFGLIASSQVVAKPAPAGPPPAIMQNLLACRSITDSTQRLACYDRASGAVAQALGSKDLVVIDKKIATEARRSLFGFSVPSFAGLLGGGDLNEIQSTVEGAIENGYAGWTIRLADGSVWAQTDDAPVALGPRKGDKVTVKRGTLGSYYLKLGNQPGIKVRRVS